MATIKRFAHAVLYAALMYDFHSLAAFIFVMVKFAMWGISLKRIEQALATGYGLFAIAAALVEGGKYKWLATFAFGMMCLSMFVLTSHRNEAVKRKWRMEWFGIFFRIFLQSWGAATIIVNVALLVVRDGHPLQHVFNMLHVLCLILYWHFTVLPDVPPRKRDKKLSWSKIKELFGSAWLPAPQPTRV